MKATLKKRIERLSNHIFLGRSITATHREHGASVAGEIIEATGREIVVSFDNGRFEPFIRRFRRDTGTEFGGSFRLNLSAFAG